MSRDEATAALDKLARTMSTSRRRRRIGGANRLRVAALSSAAKWTKALRDPEDP